MSKVGSAISALRERNSEIRYVGYEERFEKKTAVSILRGKGGFGTALNQNGSVAKRDGFRDDHRSTDTELVTGGYDIIVDCTDNPATRYLISDVCVALGKILVSGAAQRAEGQLMRLCYPPPYVPPHHAAVPPQAQHLPSPTSLEETSKRESSLPSSLAAEEDADRFKNMGTRGSISTPRGPCYRCIFPVPPSAETVQPCSEIGILGPVVGLIGTLMAMDVIKIITSQSFGTARPLTSSKDEATELGLRSEDKELDSDQKQEDEKWKPSMLLYNALAPDPRHMFRTIDLRKSPRKDCVACGDEVVLSGLGKRKVTVDEFELGAGIDYMQFCGIAVNLGISRQANVSDRPDLGREGEFFDRSEGRLPEQTKSDNGGFRVTAGNFRRVIEAAAKERRGKRTSEVPKRGLQSISPGIKSSGPSTAATGRPNACSSPPSSITPPLVLDVREEVEYDLGAKVAGSINVPISVLVRYCQDQKQRHRRERHASRDMRGNLENVDLGMNGLIKGLLEASGCKGGLQVEHHVGDGGHLDNFKPRTNDEGQDHPRSNKHSNNCDGDDDDHYDDDVSIKPRYHLPNDYIQQNHHESLDNHSNDSIISASSFSTSVANQSITNEKVSKTNAGRETWHQQYPHHITRPLKSLNKQPIYFICQRGHDSQLAVQTLFETVASSAAAVRKWHGSDVDNNSSDGNKSIGGYYIDKENNESHDKKGGWGQSRDRDRWVGDVIGGIEALI